MNEQEPKSRLLDLLFDNDIIYQLSYEMCISALCKLPKVKREEDIYVIERNMADQNEFFKEIKKENNPSKYMELLRYLQYQSCPKYSTVFSINDQSDKIYFILKGEVSILLPGFDYENREQQKEKYEKQLSEFKNSYPQLEEVFALHHNGKFKINRVYAQQEDEEESEKDEDTQLWGQDKKIAEYLHPGMVVVKQLGENKFFGEIGVEFHIPRSATVVCNTDCEFAVLSSHHFYTSIPNKFLFLEKMGLQMSSSIEFFKGMRKDVLRIFSQYTKQEIYNSHEEIFTFGEKANRIYFVKRGEVMIYQKFSTSDIVIPSKEEYELNLKQDDPQGEQDKVRLAVTVCGPGQYFGEDGILFMRGKGKRVTQAIAKRQSEVFSINGEGFFNNLRALRETDLLSYEKIIQQLKDKKQGEIQAQRGETDMIWKKELYETDLSQYQDLDVLKTGTKRKNIFQLYEDEKEDFKLLGNILDQDNEFEINLPLQQQQQQQQQQYLYKTFDHELNPQIFIKKQCHTGSNKASVNHTPNTSYIYKTKQQFHSNNIQKMQSTIEKSHQLFHLRQGKQIVHQFSSSLHFKSDLPSTQRNQDSIDVTPIANNLNQQAEFSNNPEIINLNKETSPPKTPTPFLTNWKSDNFSQFRKISFNYTECFENTSKKQEQLRSICQLSRDPSLVQLDNIAIPSSRIPSVAQFFDDGKPNYPYLHTRTKSMETKIRGSYYYTSSSHNRKNGVDSSNKSNDTLNKVNKKIDFLVQDQIQNQGNQNQEKGSVQNQEIGNASGQGMKIPFSQRLGSQQSQQFRSVQTPIVESSFNRRTQSQSDLVTVGPQKKPQVYGVNTFSIIKEKLGFMYNWIEKQENKVQKKNSTRTSNQLLPKDPYYFIPYQLSLKKPSTSFGASSKSQSIIRVGSVYKSPEKIKQNPSIIQKIPYEDNSKLQDAIKQFGYQSQIVRPFLKQQSEANLNNNNISAIKLSKNKQLDIPALHQPAEFAKGSYLFKTSSQQQQQLPKQMELQTTESQRQKEMKRKKVLSRLNLTEMMLKDSSQKVDEKQLSNIK